MVLLVSIVLGVLAAIGLLTIAAVFAVIRFGDDAMKGLVHGY